MLDRSAPGLGTKAAQPYENGPKDVVVSLPNPDPEGHPGAAVTRVLATFDIKGRFVWHCHILEHEDNEMMRPLQVT